MPLATSVTSSYMLNMAVSAVLVWLVAASGSVDAEE